MIRSAASLPALALGALLHAPAALALSVDVVTLDSAPNVDGVDSEWASLSATSIPLKNSKADGKTTIDSVSIKAAVHGDRIYFCLEWQDATADEQHKPFVWDDGKGKYVAGPQREDRLALQFAISGDYSTNWMSGNNFVADMWHWKAARSNPAGLAHDKQTIVDSKPAKRAYKAVAADGSDIYIRRPSDAGDKLYTTKRYKKQAQDVMPKYIVNTAASGSIADVQAKGVWKNGKWVLELSRKLDTGNPDDVVFVAGSAVAGGIAVFDHTGDDDHSYSEQIQFRF